MEEIKWVYTGAVSLLTVFILVTILSTILFIVNKFKLTDLLKIKYKSHSKKSKHKKRIRNLKIKKKRCFIVAITSLVLALFSFGGVKTIAYFQSVNLVKSDSSAVVEGYYLLSDFNKQLELAQEKQGNKETVSLSIQNLAGNMASYNTKKASELSTAEGQLILNRYYNSIKEIGVNAASQYTDFYGDKKLTAEFIEDVKKAQSYEKKVFTHYKIDEKELSEQK